jgi:hypothetical protein
MEAASRWFGRDGGPLTLAQMSHGTPVGVVERNGRIRVVDKKGRERSAAGEHALPYGRVRQAPLP